MAQNSNLQVISPLIEQQQSDSPQFWSDVITQLSYATEMTEISKIVTAAARKIAGSDGTTFVLKNGDKCHYYDEFAISPLWKGQQFPLSACISGWAMLNKQIAVIPDIYADARIPHDAYKPTFVKSLCMVPVRDIDPIAAIGNYWRDDFKPTDGQLKSLQILANLTAISLEKIQLSGNLQKEQTVSNDLTSKNKELELYLNTIVHDLRNAITGLSLLVSGFSYQFGESNPKAKASLGLIEGTISKVAGQVEKILSLYRMNFSALMMTKTNLSEIFHKLSAQMREHYPSPDTEIKVQPEMVVNCDPALITIVLENLLLNAFKFSKPDETRRILFTCEQSDAKEMIFSVRDNGLGFDTEMAKDLFKPMVRLHKSSKHPNTGSGLASAAKIIEAHGGRTWVQSQPLEGSIFYFSLPA